MDPGACCFLPKMKYLGALVKKKKHFIWVPMYFSTSTNCGHYFYVSYWRRDRHFTWSSEPREGPAICTAKAVPSFLSHFKTLCIVLVPGIEPATSRSAVKRSTDWDNPAAVTIIREDHTNRPLLTPSFDPQLFVTNVEVKNPFFLPSYKISYPELFESNYLTGFQNHSESWSRKL